MSTETEPNLEQIPRDVDQEFYKIVGMLTAHHITTEHTEHAVARRKINTDWSQFAHSEDHSNIIEGNN